MKSILKSIHENAFDGGCFVTRLENKEIVTAPPIECAGVSPSE